MAREMTVGKLKELLEDFDDACILRLMTQEHWPFENAIKGIADADELGDEDGNAYRPKDTGSEAVVYLVEGRQIGYGSKAAWNAARR